MNYYIIDTDIGDDIDDAYALDLALKNNLNLVGITTVFNNTELRARIARRMCLLKGKDIPAYLGCSMSLDGYKRADIFSQYSKELNDEIYNPANTLKEEAIDFIIDSAKKYKNKLYILSMGPLTNVASAILKNKDVMKEIGGIIMMGGDYSEFYAEWNIACDIKAAKIVLESDINITAFGHEWTSKLKLNDEEQNYLLEKKSSEYTDYLRKLNKLWLEDKKPGWKVVLHDLTTVRYAIDPSYAKIKRIPIYVADEEYILKGLTVDLTKMERIKKEHYINVCEELDPIEFKNYFINQMKENE